MFLVSDRPFDRHARIRSFLLSDPGIAVLLAAVNLEWTLKRALLALSQEPTADVRESLRSVFQLERYSKEWRQRLRWRGAKRLPQIVLRWQAVNKAFSLRSRLVHGMGSCSTSFAAPHVEVLIEAAELIQEYANSRDVDLYAPLKTRKRAKGTS